MLNFQIRKHPWQTPCKVIIIVLLFCAFSRTAQNVKIFSSLSILMEVKQKPDGIAVLSSCGATGEDPWNCKISSPSVALEETSFHCEISFGDTQPSCIQFIEERT